MINNNKTAIVNSWKRHYGKSHNPYFAEKIELVTGETPDFINGYDDGEEPVRLDNESREKNEELEFTKVPNMIY